MIKNLNLKMKHNNINILVIKFRLSFLKLYNIYDINVFVRHFNNFNLIDDTFSNYHNLIRYYCYI